MVEFSFLHGNSSCGKGRLNLGKPHSGSDGQNGGILRLIADMSARGEGAAGEREEGSLESVIVPSRRGHQIVEV